VRWRKRFRGPPAAQYATACWFQFQQQVSLVAAVDFIGKPEQGGSNGGCAGMGGFCLDFSPWIIYITCHACVVGLADHGAYWDRRRGSRRLGAPVG
jgi:hypothetical protein